MVVVVVVFHVGLVLVISFEGEKSILSRSVWFSKIG